jgi:arsenate reductase (thioredoxin)
MNPNHDMGKSPEQKRRVILFICTHNSARSQMAEGYLRARYSDLFDVHSAGIQVRGVHPVAVAVMGEIGIDISGHRSKLIDEFIGRDADVVITVCDTAHQTCPFFPGAKTCIHAGFPDPSDCTGTPRECLAKFQQVRDAIIVWIDTVFVPEYRNTRIAETP